MTKGRVLPFKLREIVAHYNRDQMAFYYLRPQSSFHKVPILSQRRAPTYNHLSSMDHNNRSVVVQQPITPARNLSQHGLPYMPPGCSNQKFQGKETKHCVPLVFSTKTKSSMDFFAFGALIYMRQFRISQEKHLSSGFQNSLL